MLAEATGGRFIVGLGTQVRAHIERRFSAAFTSPGPRMREYIQAMRAIFAAFRGDEKLNFNGKHYSFSLLPRIWSPGPMEHPDPPIYVAGVREWMCQMVDSLAVTSTWEDLPRALLDRYGDRADDIICYSVLEHWGDDADVLERWQDVNRRFIELRDG